MDRWACKEVRLAEESFQNHTASDFFAPGRPADKLMGGLTNDGKIIRIKTGVFQSLLPYLHVE